VVKTKKKMLALSGCSLSYAVCAILNCNQWPVRHYHIFLHHLINGNTFGKALLNTKLYFLHKFVF